MAFDFGLKWVGVATGQTLTASATPLITLPANKGKVNVTTLEELVAELGAAFLCADLGITPELREDHAGYIDNWLTVLKGDKRAVFTAASLASKAVDFLHGLQPAAADSTE